MTLSNYLSSRGVVGAALSLSVATTGAGVLAIPWTFQEGGVYLVAAVLCIVGFLMVMSIDYLVRCIDCLHLKSYEEISRELLGRHCEEAARWILIIYNIGIAAGYIVVVGEIFTPMLPLIQPYFPFLTDRSHVMFVAWILIMLPLSCIPYITHLHYISVLAVSATFSISAIIVYRYFVPSKGEQHHPKILYFSLSEKALLAFPVMMYSFDCQSLVFQIYTNLELVTRLNMRKVAVLSAFLTGCTYALLGTFGYLSNAPHITGNILLNYNPLKDHLVALGEAVYSFTLVIAYVLVLFPSRDAVFILIFGYNSATHELAHEAITPTQNLTASVVLSFLSMVLALRATGIVFIIALLGGMCSSTMCFSYPAAFRIMLHVRGLDRCKPHELALAVCMLAFGVVGGLAGTFIAIRM